MKFGTGLIGAVVLAVGMNAAAGAQDDGEFTYVGASLFGENEVGHKGAGEDASGDFSAELDLANGRMCYLLEFEGLDDFAAAHIHEGTKGKNGRLSPHWNWFATTATMSALTLTLNC